MKKRQRTSNSSEQWASNDDRPRVILQSRGGFMFGSLRPMTVATVENKIRKALELVREIAGEPPTGMLELSPAAFRDFEVVYPLMEMNGSTGWRTKARLSDAVKCLSGKEQELGVRYAKEVLRAIRDDRRDNSDGDTLLRLEWAVAAFQRWVEIPTDAVLTAKYMKRQARRERKERELLRCQQP